MLLIPLIYNEHPYFPLTNWAKKKSKYCYFHFKNRNKKTKPPPKTGTQTPIVQLKSRFDSITRWTSKYCA